MPSASIAEIVSGRADPDVIAAGALTANPVAGQIGHAVVGVHNDRHAAGTGIGEIDRTVVVEVTVRAGLETAAGNRVHFLGEKRAVAVAVMDHERPAPDGVVLVSVAIEVLDLDLIAGLADGIGLRAA
ncbi:MAG: hypothetical protein U0836_11400 [Pirellulales bacterium]